MAARYIGQFYAAYTAQQYTVILLDDEFVGTATVVDIAACDFNYPSGNAGRFDTVLAAEASVKLFVNDSGLDSFVEELAGAAEGRFMLSILQGISTEFIGYILPDLAQQEDTTIEVGYLLELRATDGLARLKTIDYNADGVVYAGDATIITHILNCLNKLTSITAGYGPSNYLLKTRVNWHSDQHTYTVGNEDPLELTRINYRAFYTVDNRGNYKFMSCFDVLSEICRAWGARMVYSDYAFWFVQYNEMATDAAQTVFTYTKTGTQASESVDFRKDHDQTDDASDLVRRSGGVFRFYPPLMKTQVDYKHIATRNLLAGQTAPFASPYNAGPVDAQNQTGNMLVSFDLRARVDDRTTPPGDVPLWLLFNVLVQVDNLVLLRTADVSGGGVTYGSAGWSATTTDRYRVAFLIGAGPVDFYFSESFFTGSLVSSGDFIFDIEYVAAFLEDGTPILDAPAPGDIVFYADNLSAVHLYNGTLGGQADIRRFVSTNNAAGNSAMTEITTIIGDGIGTNSPGHLESYDGTNWVLSEGWRVGGTGSYLAHSALLAQEVIRGQLTPVRKFQGEYNNRNTSIYKPHHVIKRADGIMVFSGGRFAPAIDSIQGEWYFISPQSSGWTNEPFEDIPADQSGGTTGGGSTTGGGGSTTPPLRIFSQHFDTVTANTVTVTVNSGTLPTNADALLVFWNGQLITSAFYTVTGSDIEFTFDVTDNVTVKFFIQ